MRLLQFIASFIFISFLVSQLGHGQDIAELHLSSRWLDIGFAAKLVKLDDATSLAYAAVVSVSVCDWFQGNTPRFWRMRI